MNSYLKKNQSNNIIDITSALDKQSTDMLATEVAIGLTIDGMVEFYQWYEQGLLNWTEMKEAIQHHANKLITLTDIG